MTRAYAPEACQRAGASPSMQGNVLERAALPEIEIYTQPWCPFCSRAVNLLKAKGVAYREIDAPGGTPERQQAIKRSGGRTTVPQVFVGDRYIGDCDQLMALDRAGKLDALLAA